MISVVTLTYNRTHLVQEAIQSFILQNSPECEMIVLNDKTDLHYNFDHPNVRIVNLKTRTSCILEKLLIGFKEAKYEYIYRLDDDDLLAPNALSTVSKYIEQNPNYDLYRSCCYYAFINNYFDKIFGGINNGNIFRKQHYLNMNHPHRSIDEDAYMLYECGAKTYTYDFISMIYRWGMSTFHISGYGIISTQDLYNRLDQWKQETGEITLVPQWVKNYWELLPT